MKIEGVIFDLDGTIYDKKSLKFRFVASYLFRLKLLRAYLKTRKQLEGVEFDSNIDFEDKQLELLIKLSKQSRKKCSRFIDDFMNQFVHILHKHYQPYSEVTSVISKLNELNIPVVCLSDYSHVSQRLVALGVDVNNFRMIKSSSDYGALKPATKSFKAIANELGFAAENMVVVGDRDDTDGEGARNSGMQFVKYPERFNEFKNKI